MPPRIKYKKEKVSGEESDTFEDVEKEKKEADEKEKEDKEIEQKIGDAKEIQNAVKDVLEDNEPLQGPPVGFGSAASSLPTLQSRHVRPTRRLCLEDHVPPTDLWLFAGSQATTVTCRPSTWGCE